VQRANQDMLNFKGKRIYLACGKTDGRKGINGLAATVQNSFALDPYETAIFVFCNGARDRIKILEYEDGGFWLYIKRLEHTHFQWPAASNDKTMTITDEDLYHLLASPGLTQKLRRIKYGHAIA